MSADEAVFTDSSSAEWSLVPDPNIDESPTSNISNGSENNETVQESENIDNKNNEDSFYILSRITKETMGTQSNLVDHITLGSAFSDIEDKLSSVLLENKQLKNLLQQRDGTVRQQYTTIVVLEKEVMQICDDYKKKFSEAKDIMNKLKKENSGLRILLESNNSSNRNTQNSVSDKSNSAVQSILRHRYILETEDGLNVTNDAPSERETRLIAQIRGLTQNLDDVKKSYQQIQSVLTEIEDRHATDLDQYSEQLRKSHKELKALKQKLDSTNHTELLKQITLSYKRKLETKYLCQVLFFLEKMCKKSAENILTQNSKPSCEESSGNSNDISNYNKKLHELVTCFFETCARDLDTKEFPKECDNIVKIFKNTQISINNLPDTQTENEENEEYNVSNYHKMLLEEHMQNIKDNQTTMFIQRQYLKVLSDYNKVVSQLEVLKFENFKLFKDKCEIEEDNSENLAAIEKCLREDIQICKNEKASMIAERLDIEREKEEIREDKNLLEAERETLLEEKHQIIEDHKEIIDENLLLNQTIAELRGTQKSLKSDNSLLEEQLKEARTELDEVKEQIETANNNIAQLRHDMSKMTVNENELLAYQLQSEILESTIAELREAERNFLTQIEILSNDVHQLREENEQLRGGVQYPPQNNPQI